MARVPGYYTIDEAKEVLEVSHSQVTRYIKDGLLKAIDLGHQKLIEQEAVHNFKRPLRGNPTFRKRQTA